MSEGDPLPDALSVSELSVRLSASIGGGCQQPIARVRSEPNALGPTVRKRGSTMSPSPTDRRVRRTQELLRGALMALIMEKGYDRITVQDILDEADVGRSTFYAHYRDKEDLLLSGFDDIRTALAEEAHPSGAQAGGKADFLQ